MCYDAHLVHTYPLKLTTAQHTAFKQRCGEEGHTQRWVLTLLIEHYIDLGLPRLVERNGTTPTEAMLQALSHMSATKPQHD
jgi:hypothetical protein